MSWDDLNNFCREIFSIPYSFIATNKVVVDGKFIVNLKAVIPNAFIFKKLLSILIIKTICYFFKQNDDILNDENTKYISNLKENLINKTGKGSVNKTLHYLPKMHLALPSTVSSKKLSNGSFHNTGKYSFCRPGTNVQNRINEGYKGVNSLDNACREHDVSIYLYTYKTLITLIVCLFV